MSDELKPCPFCGGEAWLYDAVNDEGFNIPLGSDTFYARCRKGCGHLWDDRAKAIVAWNRRTTPPPESGAVEEARDAVWSSLMQWKLSDDWSTRASLRTNLARLAALEGKEK